MFGAASLFSRAHGVNVESHPELGDADPYLGLKWKQTFLKPLEGWFKRTL